MKKITCISYHGTGSGAVDDFLKEFDNCSSAPTDIECRFLQDPDGIADLEYNLIENPHRLNSGYSLKRYLMYAKSMKRSYTKIFGKNWLNCTENYINSLISIKYEGYWHCDTLILPLPQKILYTTRKAINKILPSRIRKPGYYNYLPKLKFFHTNITEQEFLTYTKIYVDRLCESLNSNHKEFVLLDQLVPTSNIERYIRYVNDLKIIVVDRDPRDLYIQQILVKDHVLPQTAENFAMVYRDQRAIAKKINNPNVIYIQFEDLIYKYEETTKKIIDFIGEDIKHHKNPKGKFDPSISINNVHMWERHPEYQHDIEMIEKMLPEYLYHV